MTYAYKERVAYLAEYKRLSALGHPRIYMIDKPYRALYIDHWCDGNEKESDEVDKITRKITRLYIAIEKKEKENTITDK